MLNHEVAPMAQLETRVDGVVASESDLNKTQLMGKTGKFYRELRFFYDEVTWQAQAVKILTNLTDGTMRKTSFAQEQLRVLLNKLQPGETQNVGTQICVLEPNKVQYGWHNPDTNADNAPMMLIEKEPQYFDKEARESYLKKLLGLNYAVFKKNEKNLPIDRSAIVITALLNLLIKSESGGDKNNYKNEIYEVVRGFSVMTDDNLDILENSELAKWLGGENKDSVRNRENQRPLDLASKMLNKLLETYHEFQNIPTQQKKETVVNSAAPYVGLIHTDEDVCLLEVYDIDLERAEQRERHYFLEMSVKDWGDSVLVEDELFPEKHVKILNTAREDKVMVSVDEKGNYRSLQNNIRSDVLTLQDMIVGIVILESRQINGAIKLKKMEKLLEYELPKLH